MTVKAPNKQKSSTNNSLAKRSHGIMLIISVLLIVVFLVLPALTGPMLNIWWVTLSIEVIGEWQFGAQGACPVGVACNGASSTSPTKFTSMRIVFIYHHIAAVLFLLLAGTHYWLLRWYSKDPTEEKEVTAGKWTRYIQFFIAPTVVVPVPIADLIVWGKLKAIEVIENVSMTACFWIVFASLPGILIWVYLAKECRNRVLGERSSRETGNEH